jgi:DNA gyrase subunit A
MQRPDLTSAEPSIVKYIEYLEKKLGIGPTTTPIDLDHTYDHFNEPLLAEPETTLCVITISERGLSKRSFRHLYTRQHRGGMGVFDLDVVHPDFPCTLGLADENQNILLFTNRARVFRFATHNIENGLLHIRGSNAFERLGIDSSEKIVAVLPEQAQGYVALLGSFGKVRCLRHHLFGEHMRQGTGLFNTLEFGSLTSACWTTGDAELFIVTRQGTGIRFAEKAISPQGDLGIRVGQDDAAVGIAPVDSESRVFMLGSDGRGTIRQMSGFAANKSAGGSGKIAFKNSNVLGAVAVQSEDDLFVVTRLGKMVRFPVDEIPITDGPVQGVNCVALRADEVTSFIRSGSR